MSPHIRRSTVAAALCALLASCAGNPSYVAGPVYELPGGAEATFAAGTSVVSAEQAAEIRRAGRAAIFPSLDGTDAATVAEARAETGMTIVSADRTTRWAQRAGSPTTVGLSPLARTALLQEFARDVGADIAIDTRVTRAPDAVAASLTGVQVLGLDTVVVSVRDGSVLWAEQQELRLRPGREPVSPELLNLVVIRGVAEGFNAIRGS